ncbi:MAG: VapE domain-containing protein [Paraprevotella clara]
MRPLSSPHGTRPQLLCLAAHEAGIPCWDRDVSRFVASDRLPDYHPFRDYFDRLPPWDGKDRLDALAQRVSDSALWVSGFRRWMLAVAAQWMGMGDGHANSVAPVLVSGRQGLGKSTFCRNLLPPELSAYYTDSVDVANTARMEQLLVEMGLINLDEFDRIPVRRHPALKNVMQLTDLHVRKAYRRDTLRLPRIASFIATSNSHELLSDPSGSRRFLCVEVERPIDSTDIGHAQIYAQLKAMLLGGERHGFTAEEEAEIQRANVAFYRTCPAEEAFARHFRAARPDEEALSVSLPELIALLRKRQPGTLTGIGMQEFSRALVTAGVERRHTEKGNRYRIVPLEHEGCKSAILSE